jgi:hypothetical protein
VADFEKVIPPGREGSVNIKIDGKKLGTAGHFKKSFTVKTNDPKNKQFVLAVEGNVKQAFEFSDKLLLEGFADEDLKAEIIITDLLPTPINITEVRWSGDATSRRVLEKVGLKLETIAKGKKYRLKIWKKEEMPVSSFGTSVVLLTDHPILKEKIVPVMITIRNDIEMSPNRMILGEMILKPGGAKSFNRVFSISAARGDSLRILKAEPNRSDMTVTIKEITPGKVFQGTVSIAPGGDTTRYVGSIKIQTNYRRCREFNLDIVGSVRKET